MAAFTTKEAIKTENNENINLETSSDKDCRHT